VAATVCRCEGCGREFIAARSHARWHSDACRIAHARKSTTVSREEEVCPNCGTFTDRLDSFAGWCAKCVAERRRAEAA
jgi:hypothetical protein